MNPLFKYLDKFLKLKLSERLLIVLLLGVAIYFLGDFVLLKPQQRKIIQLQQLDTAHKTELALVNSTLAEIEENLPAGVQTLNAASLEAIKQQIAEADALFGEIDVNASQTGTLVKRLLSGNPTLTLISLNTLPTTPFITIDAVKPSAIPNPNAKPIPSTIFSYGVDVSIKGNYLALLSYMENLRRYPKRLFWSNATLDVDEYPNAILKLSLYSLSAQPNAPLR